MRRTLAFLGIFALLCCSGTQDDPASPPNGSSARDSVTRDSIRRDSLRRDSIALAGDSVPPAALHVLKVADLSYPVYLTAPSGDTRLFVVELPGKIRIIRNGEVLPTPFLDISSGVSMGGERGLLSVAFHPAYATNHFFYVYYTDLSGDIQIQRYQTSDNPDVADPGSAVKILSIEHSSQNNHNGGLLRFGPDGMLYAGIGDGGGGGDPDGNGQNQSSYLGKLLRLDVDHGSPFGTEVWAYGLRNPWRYAFDNATGLLYIADVGQNVYEEVDVQPANKPGINYGWNVMEGMHCFNGSSCTGMSGLILPVLEYTHAQGCSITGGSVYRGSAIHGMKGRYFYSDYCGGWLRSFRYVGGKVTEERTWSVGNLGMIVSFGEDSAGELYLLSQNGTVYRITP